jgi:hypothetical protein
MRHAPILVLIIASVATASFALAQAIPRNPDIPQQPNTERPRSGNNGIGLGFSFKLAPKKKPELPIEEAAIEMRDAVIAPYVDGQVIFVVEGEGINLAAIARTGGVTILETSYLSEAGVTMVVAGLPNRDTPLSSATRLARLPGVSFAQPNFQFQLLSGPALPRRFALHAIPQRQPKVSGKLVMIDAAVDIEHVSLAGAGVSQEVFGVDGTPALHGTAVAGLLVGTGSAPGTAQGAQLTSLAAFGPPERGASLSRTAYLARAMNRASILRPDVLNLSFGGPQDPLLALMLTTLNKNGVCVAAAAGNAGPQGEVLFPASHPSSLAVTAVDENLRSYAFASRGERIDIAGVGVGLSAAVPGGRRIVSGTSFSTAVISGALLRMPACSGGRNPGQMKAQVSEFAQDLGPTGRDAIFGAGLFRLTPPRGRR